MTAARDPAEVIGRILKVIPAGETALRTRLEVAASDSFFLPPEDKRGAWVKLSAALYERFGTEPPGPGWPLEVSEIIRGIR